MGMRAEYDGLGRSVAESLFALEPVHPTLPGTEFTLLEDAVSFLDLLSKFTLLL